MLDRILSHRSMQVLVLLFVFVWIDTGSSIVGKVTAILLLLYVIGAFINPNTLINDELHPKIKEIYKKFGGYLLLILVFITFLNLHTKNTITEGIFLIIFLALILTLTILKKDLAQEKFKEWLITIIILSLLIIFGITFIIWPDPTQTDIFDFFIYIGMIREIINGVKKRQNGV